MLVIFIDAPVVTLGITKREPSLLAGKYTAVYAAGGGVGWGGEAAA
jgi:hypothetical protein